MGPRFDVHPRGQPQMEASRHPREPVLRVCACMEVLESDPPVKGADRPVQGAGSQIRRQWAEDPPAGMSKCLLNVQQISRYTTEDPAARGPGPEIRRPV